MHSIRRRSCVAPSSLHTYVRDVVRKFGVSGRKGLTALWLGRQTRPQPSPIGEVTVKRDATPPIVTFATNGGVYTVDQSVSVTCSASDDLSGVQSSTCANVSRDAYTFALGTTNFSATAIDYAGNTGTGTTSIQVSVTRGSLCALVRRWVANQGVANSLCVKLDKGNYAPFQNEVQAQSGKWLTAERAAILLRWVNYL